MQKISNFCSTSDVTKIYIVEPLSNGIVNALTAHTLTVTGNIYNCGVDSVAFFNTISACSTSINVGSDLIPIIDSTINLGSPARRFRSINTVSGTSTVWSFMETIYTPSVNLGFDLSGNTRILTAENAIIQDDILIGGFY